MKRQFTINIKGILYFIYCGLIFPPEILGHLGISSLLRLMDLLGYVASLGIIILYVLNRNISKNMLAVFLFAGWIIVCDMIAGFDTIPATWTELLRVFGFCCMIYLAYKNGDEKIFLGATSTFMVGMVLLNLASQIIWPNGIVPGSGGTDWQPHYVLGNPNSFAFAFLFTFIVLMTYYTRTRKKRNKGLAIVSLLLTISAALGNYSSTGFIICLTLTCAVLLRPLPIFEFIKRHMKVVAIGVFVCLASIVFGAWRNQFLQELIYNVTGERGSFLERGLIWNNAMQLIKESPIYGYGSTTLRYSLGIHGAMRSAHNTFLQTAVFWGIPELIIYIYLYVRAIIVVRSNARNDFSYYALISIVLLITVCMFEQNPIHVGFFALISIIDCESNSRQMVLG